MAIYRHLRRTQCAGRCASGRLILLQITDGGQGAVFLREQGALRTVRTAEIPVYRGLIEDRNGTPLAVSSPVVSLWANPQQLKDSPRLNDLATLLSLDASALQDKLNFYGDKQFMYLARHQTPDFAGECFVKVSRVCGESGSIVVTTLQERSPRRFWV